MGSIVAVLPSIIQLITQYGVPAAKTLYTMFSQTGGPTAADWTALEAACSVTARQQMLATLAAHNIDPASPQGIAFLALTPA